AAEAPFWNSDLAIATAAYEHELEAAPRLVASATGLAPEPDSERSMRARGTQACTMPEIAKPSTSAHQTAQAIRNESRSPCQITSRTSIAAPVQARMFEAHLQSPVYPLGVYCIVSI